MKMRKMYRSLFIVVFLAGLLLDASNAKSICEYKISLKLKTKNGSSEYSLNGTEMQIIESKNIHKKIPHPNPSILLDEWKVEGIESDPDDQSIDDIFSELPEFKTMDLNEMLDENDNMMKNDMNE